MPALNEDTIAALVDAIQDHALQSGYFDRVNGHEPSNAPGSRLTAALWVDSITPLGGASGLDAVSGRLAFLMRIYQNFRSDPLDAIDPSMLAATNALCTAYAGDFTLGGQVRNVDLLGEYGIPLQTQAGYVEMDQVVYRVYTISLPLIINDLWSENP